MGRIMISTTAAAVALAAVAVASPASAQGPQRNVQRDTETYEEYVPNRGLIVSGAIVLGATYAISTMVATRGADPADRALFVPVIGPWIDLARRDGCTGDKRCDGETTNQVLLVADGIGQSIGALQLVGGFLFPSRRIVTTVGGVHIAPTAGAMGTGLTAYGAF